MGSTQGANVLLAIISRSYCVGDADAVLGRAVADITLHSGAILRHGKVVAALCASSCSRGINCYIGFRVKLAA